MPQDKSTSVAIDFAWSGVRLAACFAMLCTPAIAVWVLGSHLLFQGSREFNLKWAADSSRGVNAAAPTLQLLTQEVETRRTPAFVRWLAGLYATGKASEARGFERRAEPFANGRLEILAIRATVAEKLAEIGETKMALEMIAQIQSEAKDTSEEDGFSSRRIAEATVHIQDPKEFPKRKEHGKVSKTRAMLEQYIQAMDANKNNRSWKTLEFAVEASIEEPRERFRIVDTALIVHQQLLERELVSEADAVLTECLHVQRSLASLVQKMSASDLSQDEDDGMLIVAIEVHVMIAKSLRFPIASRIRAARNLKDAELLLTENTPSRLRTHALSRLAAGYARIGNLALAREMCVDALPRDQLLVAKEMFANEYEEEAIRSGTEASNRVAKLGLLRRAFDEQTDPTRTRPDYPR